MVTKKDLKKYAERLMFDMDDLGYDRCLKEFEVVEKHMDLIGKIDNIDSVEPMTFPYVIHHAKLREDKVVDTLSLDEVLKNCDDSKYDQVRVPRVVEK